MKPNEHNNNGSKIKKTTTTTTNIINKKWKKDLGIAGKGTQGWVRRLSICVIFARSATLEVGSIAPCERSTTLEAQRGRFGREERWLHRGRGLGGWQWRRVSQPILRRECGRKAKEAFSKKENAWKSPLTFIQGKMLEKPKRGLRILKIRVQELFTHREGISTPTRPSQGTTIFDRVCITWLQNYVFFLFIFFIFWGSARVLPLLLLSSSAMRNSDLRSSLSLKVCMLNWFYVFERFTLIANKKSFKVLDLETMF